METQNKTAESRERTVTRRQALKYAGAGIAGAAGLWFGVKHTLLKDYFSGEDDKDLRPVATKTDPRTGAAISLLAFGCMRLPLVEQGKPDIDEPRAMEMIDYAYRHGVNYFDTAWFYHQGLSETFIGKALQRYPRETFHLADKMPGRMVKSLDHAKEIFAEQLKKCQVDYFDFYLLHSIGSVEDYDRVYEEYGVYHYLAQQKAEGRIRRLGFSFHGHRNDFPYFAGKHEWDFAMIQANYLDWDADGAFLYNELEQRNIPCLIMEPVRGGMLATLNPDAVQILKEADANRSAASWAIQWIASKPNVLTVLSGMTTLEQVKDNVKTMAGFEPMTEAQHATVAKALAAFQRVKPVPCTECEYCMPCPAGVNIPLVFKTYNKCVSESNVPDPNAPRNGDFRKKRRAFLASMNNFIAEKERATRCIGCNHCLPLCPQRIAITDQMHEISGLIKALA
ncbi:MAG: aldo/keto reductase [Prevotellaceae bacterium]|jgi:predicted aldo/keto reductase-like oxidoreductase|nr:aldo/keto reductase [Prevotellaceae bacterium]